MPSAAVTGVGGAVGITAVGLLGFLTGSPLLIAPFGSTCMMIFGAPGAPFAQPRNVILGHLICTLTGLITIRAAGGSFVSVAAAVGAAMALMGVSRSFHPPAGGDTVVVMLTDPSWWFLVVPILSGCLVLVATAWMFHRLRRRGSYPAPSPALPEIPKPNPSTVASTGT